MWGRISRDSRGRGALREQRSSHRAKKVNWVFQGVGLAETGDEAEKQQEGRDWKVLTATERVQVEVSFQVLKQHQAQQREPRL